MTLRLPEDKIPNEKPWRDREFLEWAIHERGLLPREIAYVLDTETTRVTEFAERLGVTRPWRHRPTLRRLYFEQGLSPDEIAARDKFDCSPVTIERYLAKYDLSDDDPDNVTYRQLDELNPRSQQIDRQRSQGSRFNS